MSSPRGVRIVTLTPGCGYGDAASQYVAALDALGIPVTWTAVEFNTVEPVDQATALAHADGSIRERLARTWQRRIDYDTLLLDVPPAISHQRWLQSEPAVRPFAYAAHELDYLPEDWAPALNRFAHVFVPSELNRKVFIDGGVAVPVDVVPHIARAAQPDVAPLQCTITDDDFVFYTIGEWTTRKAMEETVRAYLDTFDANEKVVLIIKTDPVDWIEMASLSGTGADHAPHLATTWWSLARIVASYKAPAKLHLIAEKIPPAEIDRLHTRGDCFVSLTRSEGWGLCPFDALLFGNPVIVTGWGGQLDYLGHEYPLAVRHALVSTLTARRDGHHLRSAHARWAEADRQHAGELMRSVFERPEGARAVARALGARLREQFAPAVVGPRLAESMGFSVGP